jgi:hypothetical protein
MFLTRKGVLIEYNPLLDKIGHEGIRKIRSMFTIVTIGHNNSRKTICSFKIIGRSKKEITFMVLPRFGGFMLQKAGLIGEITNSLQKGECVDFKEPDISLTSNQTTVLHHLLTTTYTQHNIDKGTASATIQMDPGYGKTYLAMGLISTIKKKTMIIVPNTYLLRQWVSILESVFPKNTIGCYYGVKKTDGDVVVAIVNSALKYTEYEKYGLIIYDEVHMYCSSKFAAIFSTAHALCCLGLTATPFDRIDKFDPVAHWALGKPILAENIEGWDPVDVVFSTEVTRVIFNGHEDFTRILTSSAGIVSVPLMVNQIQDDHHRNTLIVAYAITLYRTGRNVFVFSDRREHLHTLAKILIENRIEFDAPELDIGVAELMGGSTDNDIEAAKINGRIIMTTYQYSGTGVSINKMNSIILATPRKSNMKQILGRIYRLSSDATVVRNIIDIVDNKTCLKAQYSARKKVYVNNLSALITPIKISWGDCDNLMELIARLASIEQ